MEQPKRDEHYKLPFEQLQNKGDAEGLKLHQEGGTSLVSVFIIFLCHIHTGICQFTQGRQSYKDCVKTVWQNLLLQLNQTVHENWSRISSCSTQAHTWKMDWFSSFHDSKCGKFKFLYIKKYLNFCLIFGLVPPTLFFFLFFLYFFVFFFHKGNNSNV